MHFHLAADNFLGRKLKEKVMKQLCESFINSEWHENKELQDKSKKV